MKNKIKDIVFNALLTSYSDSIIIHKIDSKNSAIEMDYNKITKEILDAIDKNGYKIIKKIKD